MLATSSRGCRSRAPGAQQSTRLPAPAGARPCAVPSSGWRTRGRRYQRVAAQAFDAHQGATYDSGRAEGRREGGQPHMHTVQPLVVLDTLQRVVAHVLAVGARLTALVSRVGQSVAADLQRVLWWQARLSRGRTQAAAADAQRASTDAAQTRRQKLERLAALAQRGTADPEFLAMLCTLDDSHTALEHKWAAMARHVAREKDFQRHTAELFRLAEESSRAVQAAGAAGAAVLKSAHSKLVIQHEEALKRHVFVQMLQHGQAPRAA